MKQKVCPSNCAIIALFDATNLYKKGDEVEHVVVEDLVLHNYNLIIVPLIYLQ